MNIFMGPSFSFSSRDDKLQGVLVKVGFKTATVLWSRKGIKMKSAKAKKDYIFGISIYELVRSRRSPALNVLGGEANCVILPRHRAAARRFLPGFIEQKNDRTRHFV